MSRLNPPTFDLDRLRSRCSFHFRGQYLQGEPLVPFQKCSRRRLRFLRLRRSSDAVVGLTQKTTASDTKDEREAVAGETADRVQGSAKNQQMESARSISPPVGKRPAARAAIKIVLCQTKRAFHLNIWPSFPSSQGWTRYSHRLARYWRWKLDPFNRTRNRRRRRRWRDGCAKLDVPPPIVIDGGSCSRFRGRALPSN